MQNNKKIVIVGTPTGFHNPFISRIFRESHLHSIKVPEVKFNSSWNNSNENIAELLEEKRKDMSNAAYSSVLALKNFKKYMERLYNTNFIPSSGYKFSFEEKKENITDHNSFIYWKEKRKMK